MSVSSASELELVLLDPAPLQLEREGIKKIEDGKRGGGGRLFEGGDLSRDGYYSRTAFFSESWLCIIILSHLNCPQGYVMVRKDQAGSRIGGGVAMI